MSKLEKLPLDVTDLFRERGIWVQEEGGDRCSRLAEGVRAGQPAERGWVQGGPCPLPGTSP